MKDIYWAAANHSRYNHLYDNESRKALCGSKARRKQYKHLQGWQDQFCPRCMALAAQEEDDTCSGRYPWIRLRNIAMAGLLNTED